MKAGIMKALPTVIAACLVALGLSTPANGAQQGGAAIARTITNVRGDLYQVQDGERVTVFLVTPDGIVLVDPLSGDTAAWLRDEFARQFPGRDVRYVLHTHHRLERADGASLFRATAVNVGQARFNDEREEAARSLPVSLLGVDSNHDGVLQPGEIASARLGKDADVKDLNRDDSLTPQELYATVPTVTRTFEERETITLGGHTVQLWWTPMSYATDMTVIVFPAERVAFSADLLAARTLPEQLGPQNIARTIASLRVVEGLSFDTMVTGGGERLAKSDVSMLRKYLEDLEAGVRQGFSEGRSLSEVQTSVTLEEYRQWRQFDIGRSTNIGEVYNNLRWRDLRVFGAGAFNASSASTWCGDSWECGVEDFEGRGPRRISLVDRKGRRRDSNTQSAQRGGTIHGEWS